METKEKVMNKIVHFEIPVENATRAKKFYDTFGWDFVDIPEMDYTATEGNVLGLWEDAQK